MFADDHLTANYTHYAVKYKQKETGMACLLRIRWESCLNYDCEGVVWSPGTVIEVIFTRVYF